MEFKAGLFQALAALMGQWTRTASKERDYVTTPYKPPPSFRKQGLRRSHADPLYDSSHNSSVCAI